MPKLYEYGPGLLCFTCPGCKFDHPFHVAPQRRAPGSPLWEWNGSMDKPTFTPSLMCNRGTEQQCHCYVTDGKIQFLNDSHHELAGQTVELPEWGE